MTEEQLNKCIENHKVVWRIVCGKPKRLQLSDNWVVGYGLPCYVDIFDSKVDFGNVKKILTQKRDGNFIYISIDIEDIFATKKEAQLHIKKTHDLKSTIKGIHNVNGQSK